MLKRADCLSVAMMLAGREAELVEALRHAGPLGVRQQLERELKETQRLAEIFDRISGRSLDFTKVA